MKFDVKDMPAIRQTAGRTITPIDIEALKQTGVAFASYGINEGEIITFGDDIEGMLFNTQPVRPNSEAKQVLVSVLRDGKPGWLSMGSLTRTGIGNKTAEGSVVTEEMLKLNNNAERIAALAGKKITATATVQVECPTFEDGKADVTKPVLTDFRVLNYVD